MVRPNRQRIPVFLLTPTSREASALLIPWLTNRMNRSRFSVSATPGWCPSTRSRSRIATSADPCVATLGGIRLKIIGRSGARSGDHTQARLAAPVEQVVQDMNLFLRGWAGYFRYGNSAQAFDKTRNYAVMRLALFLAKRHHRPTAWGFAQVYRSRDTFGLVSLNGIVAAPRPKRAWRAPVEHRR